MNGASGVANLKLLPNVPAAVLAPFTNFAGVPASPKLKVVAVGMTVVTLETTPTIYELAGSRLVLLSVLAAAATVISSEMVFNVIAALLVVCNALEESVPELATTIRSKRLLSVEPELPVLAS